MLHWQHPYKFSYFPANTSFESMLGELVAMSLNNPGFSWNSNPASTELEVKVSHWVGSLMGLEEFITDDACGCIQPSSSESVLLAIIIARENALKKHENISQDKLLIYASTQTHSAALKASRVLNLNIRFLDVSEEDEFSLRGHTFQNALDEDIKNGWIPFILGRCIFIKIKHSVK